VILVAPLDQQFRQLLSFDGSHARTVVATCGPATAGSLDLPNATDTKTTTVWNVENRCEQMDPDQFWRLVEERGAGSSSAPTSLWASQAMRLYLLSRAYFSPHNANSIPRTTYECARTLTNGPDHYPVMEGRLGQPIDPSDPIVLAGDLPGLPPTRGYVRYSSKYYPRRINDYLTEFPGACSLSSAYLVTSDPEYLKRMNDLLSFALYSQYQADGSNQFVNDYYDRSFRRADWKYAFDYISDWRWRDGFGYQNDLHEGDHHVSSLMAAGLVKGYELMRRSDPQLAAKYLRAADDFLRCQVPRYGFHTGMMSDSRGAGHRYFWTEYDPSGEGNEGRDAVDNVQSLVAMAAAMVGYDAQKPEYLDYSKGLLWYVVREFEADGRFYYDGAEAAPARPDHRTAVSHDTVVLESAFQALGYLIEAGYSDPTLESELEKALIAYYHDPELLRITTLSTEFKYAHAWRASADGRVPVAGTVADISEFFLITSDKVSDIEISSPLPKASPVALSKWNPASSGGSTWDPVAAFSCSTVMLTQALPGFVAVPGDLYRLTYNWEVDDPARFNKVWNPDMFRIHVFTTDTGPTGTPIDLWRNQDMIEATYPDATDSNHVEYQLSQLPPFSFNAGNWINLVGETYFP
jgi:hypothetical protein